MQQAPLIAACLVVVLLSATRLTSAAAAAAPAAAQGQSQLPPLLAALTALRDRSSSSSSNNGSRSSSSSSRPSAAAAGSAPPPFDALRPAAAAALARQHGSAAAAPLTDGDIAAINTLLSREPPPNGPYIYDTGMPPAPHLVASSANASANSSMQSSERLGRLSSSLGEPLSWLARSYTVTGDNLLKLRITPQLQLILSDAISDSLAASANLPPNQVVTFAASNLSLSLEFIGVSWTQDAAAAAAGLPHKGLQAVKGALQELTGGFDPNHTFVSFAPCVDGSSLPPPGAAASSSARKLLLKGAASAASAALAASSSQQQQRRQLLAPGGTSAEPKLVYVRLFGMDSVNLTTLLDRLGNCSGATAEGDAAGNSVGKLPASKQPLTPHCSAIFRRHFEQQAVPVTPAELSVAPLEQPQAATGLSVAVGLTREQQLASDTDAKAAAWLNSTAMQEIMGTFNLTAKSTDNDYVTLLRDRRSGQFPELPGINLTSLLPSLFQSVLAASQNLSQLEAEQQQSGGAYAVTSNKAILAGIITAVVASVLALLGVAVLLLRRRRNDSSSATDSPQPGSERRRKRRPRLYHAKYLSAGNPVLGPEPQQPAGTGPAAADGLRHTLERGDSVMSHVNNEMDDEAQGDQGSEASSSRTLVSAPGVAEQPRRAGQQPQQQQQWRQLERQEGEAGSSGSNSRLLKAADLTSSSASSAAIVPTDSSGWDGSMALTADGSSSSQWGSSHTTGSQHAAAAGATAAAAAGELNHSSQQSGGRHRLATASQVQQQAAAAGAEESAQLQQQQQQFSSQAAGRGVQGPFSQHQQLPAIPASPEAATAAAGSFNVATAFAAMDAQLAAAVRAGAASTSGGGAAGSQASALVQPLGNSCWHKQGHVSGFLVPDAAAAAAAAAVEGGCSAGGAQMMQPQQPSQRQSGGGGGGWVSPFAAAIQLAHSVASDDV